MCSPPKRLLVTGPPGVGKTTLITRVVEKLKGTHPDLKVRGFYTREIRQSGERTGFEIVTIDGQSGSLASSLSGSNSWPKVGKYKVDVAGFEALALPELEVNSSDAQLFVIDEVGKMELFSSAFFPAVWTIFNSNIPVIASIPIPKYGRDIPEVARIRNHADTMLYSLTKNSRDRVCLEVYDHLKSLLD
ncbi:hypothetical protein KP509_38G036100 [Ceratopteris richardii]|uniref:AAA+ ATPase domain-containing protein n=1 Tax=Ceratopteris richardii TaxID=49495 RepID=A0A8T2Q3U3_CERRI|nr:hypothetical protein KP509_38G036100 [Ceratopteris richardii]